MQKAAHALTQQFLAWVAEAPRSYAMTSLAELPAPVIWEDPFDGLIRYGSSMGQSRLVLTARGASASMGIDGGRRGVGFVLPRNFILLRLDGL
jgi:hypothetical protein